ncbi:MAG: FtsW/RodA/SpoVE family cell cycle protein [Hespellia sp.]|nr:FtsW/RodA/SpoVE family cell cycle protein [Hespellia sp.]
MEFLKRKLQSLKRYHVKDFKFSLVILVWAISIIGILVVGSAQESVQSKQIGGVLLGSVIMLVIALIDYERVLDFYWILYIINLLLLVAVLFLGVKVNGAQRWLDLGFTRFQPSDLTKILMILFYAKLFMEREHAINARKNLFMAIALILPSLVLIYKQPNLSNTICLAALFAIILFLAGLDYRFIGTLLAIVVPVSIIFLSLVVGTDIKIINNYQKDRILAWLEPEEYASSEAYQQLNSVMAIGSGQLTGKGLNNNTTTSVKNGNYLSEPQTDFIFAIIGEELGFVGCCIVIILLLLIVVECILIGLKAKDTGGKLICGGVAALIGVQSFINISVATGIFPNTGISLPFVSYGITSVVCFYMGIGFVLNVGLQPKKYQ